MKKSQKDWTNNSWEAPPGPYPWACLVCEKHNPANQQACSVCGCPDRVDGRELIERQRQFKKGQPYDGTRQAKPRSRIPGRRLDGSNTFTVKELLNGAVFLLAAMVGLYQATASGYITVLASRHSEGLHVTNPLAMGIAFVGYVCVSLYGAAIWADHLDRRVETEPRYEKARVWTIGIGGACMLLSAVLQMAGG